MPSSSRRELTPVERVSGYGEMYGTLPKPELRRQAARHTPVGRRVRLEDPAGVEARLLVALSPPDFADRINAWPIAERS